MFCNRDQLFIRTGAPLMLDQGHSWNRFKKTDDPDIFTSYFYFEDWNIF